MLGIHPQRGLDRGEEDEVPRANAKVEMVAVDGRRLAAGRPRHHPAGAAAPDRPRRARSHDARRDGVELAVLAVGEEVVVAAQEARQHGADGARVVVERLAREHRRELHHARPARWRRVAPLTDLDRLVAGIDGHHGTSSGVGHSGAVAGATDRHRGPEGRHHPDGMSFAATSARRAPARPTSRAPWPKQPVSTSSAAAEPVWSSWPG